MRVPFLFPLIATLVMSTVGCGDYVSTTGPEHCGQVGDEVWGKDVSPHDVTCDVTVTGSLVIGPDTRVRFAPGTTLVVQGSLSIEGTAEKPVLFEGSEDGMGWVGIWIRAIDQGDVIVQRPDPDANPVKVVTGDVTIQHLNMTGAGLAPEGSAFVPASLIIDRGPVDLIGVSIADSRQCGITLGEFGRLGTESSDITVTNPLEAPICAHAQSVSSIPVEGVSLPEGSGVDIYGKTLTGSHVWQNRGVPYIIKDTLQVARADLTVAAGVELRIYPEVAITVGGTDRRLTYGEKKNRSETGPLVMLESARLHLAGTAGEPIVVTVSPEFGDSSFFDRIEIIGDSAQGASASAVLENVDISSGGAGVSPIPASLSVQGDADVTLTNVAIRDGGGAGLLLTDDGALNPSSSGLTITGNAFPALIDPDGAASLPKTGSSYTGNSRTPEAGSRAPGDIIYVTDGAFTQSGVVPDVGVPYRVEGNLGIEGAPDLLLTFEDGVEFLMSESSELDFGSDGSAALVIGAGGEGVTMGPATGVEAWESLVLGSQLIAPSAVNNLTVLNAGASGKDEAVRLQSAHLPVDGLTIDGASGVGLDVVGTFAEGSKNLVVRNVEGVAVTAGTDTAGSIPAEGVDLTNNAMPWVFVDGIRVSIDTSWADLGVPYHIDQQVTVSGREDGGGNPFSARLALEPGVEVLFGGGAGLRTQRFQSSSGLQANGTVEMVGTLENPVTLGAIDPSVGWGNLHLYYEDDLEDKVDRSVLDYLIVKDAAALFSFGSIEYWDSTPAVSNVTIDHSFRYGIGLQRDSFVGPRSGDPIEYGCDEYDASVYTFVGDFGEKIEPTPDEPPYLIDFRVFLEGTCP